MYFIIISVLTAAVRAGTPLLFVTQGEIFNERAGNLNLGLEGLMLIGAVTGYAGALISGNPWVGVLFAVISGAAVSSIHAFLTITLGAKQIVSGLGLVFFGIGLSALIGDNLLGLAAPGINLLKFPLLEGIPLIGPVFFRHDLLVYLSYLLVPVAWWVLNRTRIGMNIRASGEDPLAADSAGIKVVRIRYSCVIIGGALAALGGAYMSLAYFTLWVQNMTAGRGWIAIALVIFSRWDPWKALLGCYLFGGVTALQYAIQAQGATFPSQLLQMIPYIFTILVLLFATRQARRSGQPLTVVMGPRSLGKPFSREEKA